MNVFAALCMLAVGVSAGGVYQSPRFPPTDIHAFLQRVERVEEYQNELTARLENSTTRALEIYDALIELKNDTIQREILENEANQNRRLEAIYNRIEVDSLALAEQLARASGAQAQASLNEAQAYRIAKRLAELTSLNVREGADIAEIIATVSNNVAAVQSKISRSANKSQEEIDVLEASLQDLKDYVNSQICFVGETVLHFERYKNVVEATIVIPEDYFNLVPQVFCSIQGSQSKLNLQSSVPYNPYFGGSYGSYNSRVRKGRNFLDLRVECVIEDGSIRVRGFDASEGGNDVEKIYVVARACSVPPQAI